MSASATYDAHGRGYARVRQPDPRIAAALRDALDGCRTVLNVGAGAGSYEPSDLEVHAVEPSREMIRQRPADAAPCTQGQAEALPFADGSFDATTAILTLHHWRDPRRGLAELRRVSRRAVILTWDPAVGDAFWLIRDYFPAIIEDDLRRFPPLSWFAEVWGLDPELRVVPVPHDCVDGFLGAYWRRPAAYLDPEVRRGISSFYARPAERWAPGLAALARDLEDGAWARRHGALLEREALDLGYRLVIARFDAAS